VKVVISAAFGEGVGTKLFTHTVRATEPRDGLGVNLTHYLYGEMEAIVGKAIHASFFIVRA
jgi:hypothetical protein